MAVGQENPAPSSSPKAYLFRAEISGSAKNFNSTDRLEGDYKVVASKDGLQVLRLIDGQEYLIGGESADELRRMLGIGQDEREYLNKDPTKKQWGAKYSYKLPMVKKTFLREAEYKIVSEGESKTTPAGTFKTVKIECDSKAVFEVGTFKQKWVYYYAPEIDSIVEWNYDSAVDQKGAKIEIKLIGLER